MRKLIVVLVPLMFLAHASFANEVTKPNQPVKKPLEIASVIKAENPRGEGALKRLWLKGYDASLWTDAPEWSMDTTYALTLKYARDFSRDDLVERSIKEMEHAQPLTAQQKKEYSAQLSNIFPNVHENDTITSLYEPSKGTTFFYNGKKTGEITDKEFAKKFLGIWLGPKTSEPELRQALIGQK